MQTNGHLQEEPVDGIHPRAELFRHQGPGRRCLSVTGADHADLVDGVAEPLARFRAILGTGPIVRPFAARHRFDGRRRRGWRRASTRLPSSAFSHPRSEPIGRADIFDLATVSLTGDTGSAGLSRRPSLNPWRVSMKAIVATARTSRSGDPAIAANWTAHMAATQAQPARLLPAAFEREFRISRGSHVCLSGFLRSPSLR